MAKVSITDAAKLAGVSRAHLYNKYIKPGLLSVDRDNLDKPRIDTSELLRVFGELKPMSLSTNDYTSVDTMYTKEDCATLRTVIASKDEELRRAWEMVAWLQSKVDAMEPRLLQGPTTKRHWWWPW
jgi:hypothetical protein